MIVFDFVNCCWCFVSLFVHKFGSTILIVKLVFYTIMINQQQSTYDQIDYDVPPSTCGYPIYFSLCVDGHFAGQLNNGPSSKLIASP